MASISEVSGEWEGTLMTISESDSEAGSWGNSGCFSLQEKSGGSGLSASFHRWASRGELSVLFLFM